MTGKHRPTCLTQNEPVAAQEAKLKKKKLQLPARGNVHVNLLSPMMDGYIDKYSQGVI